MKELFCKSLWVQLLIFSVMGIFVYNAFLYAEGEDWMPDANLRQAVREALELTADEPLTKDEILPPEVSQYEGWWYHRYNRIRVRVEAQRITFG